MLNGPFLDFININANFGRSPSINLQDIGHKQDSDVNQALQLCWKLTKKKNNM